MPAPAPIATRHQGGRGAWRLRFDAEGLPDLLDLVRADPVHPALEWARSGAMALTGDPEGPPRLVPGPLAAFARAALRAVGALAPAPLAIDAAALLGERAALFGFERRGAIAPGGSCRLLAAADGWIAVNLARPDDRALLPAWLGVAAAEDPWPPLRRAVAGRSSADLVARARLLGLPVAPAARPPVERPRWCRISASGPRRAHAAAAMPRVVDLSSLWAGPLCTHLLSLAGATVVKVESVARPDGARGGAPEFFDLLNGGKRSVALDFGDARGRTALEALLRSADIVVESARPRALRQLGIDAESLVAEVPGLTWVSLTGYGRREPLAHRVAFGDDAAAAAGLAVAAGGPNGPPLFCGDAIADPLTGLCAAAAALATHRAGGGRLLDLALRDVAAHALALPVPCDAELRRVPGGWEVRAESARQRVLRPRARKPTRHARPFGADTLAVLAELEIPC